MQAISTNFLLIGVVDQTHNLMYSKFRFDFDNIYKINMSYLHLQ